MKPIEHACEYSVALKPSHSFVPNSGSSQPYQASLTISSYVNKVSGEHQVDAPPEFSGGIIADPMGLGKTLTMIALAATDAEAEEGSRRAECLDEDNGPDLVTTTLVIVPPPRTLDPYSITGNMLI